ncbi:MAG: methyltransferase domain-containing protein [Actinomycetota bacterium]|nr:methyltransferase domain-containing protein [Actinomycetota bacterium]
MELDRYREVHVDLGTGDGKFVLRAARARPDVLVVGVDMLAEAFADAASRAARKPTRGGAPNAVFLASDATRPPPDLHARASLVTVNYPWGSLLRAVAAPQAEPLRAIAGLLRPGGRLVALLNLSAAEDSAYAERLELPPLDGEHIEGALVPGWRDAGLAEVSWRALAPGEDPPHRTTWGQRLVRGSRRETLLVSAVRSSASS